jgi:hypothetical protein
VWEADTKQSQAVPRMPEESKEGIHKEEQNCPPIPDQSHTDADYR